MGLSLLLLALVLFGASQGALKISFDALFDEEYENACEFEWECMTGR